MQWLVRLLLLLEKGNRLVQSDGIWVRILRHASKRSGVTDIWSELTLAHNHLLVVIRTNSARQSIGKESQSIVQGEREEALSLQHRSKLRFLRIAIAQLHTRTILGYTCVDRFARLRMITDETCSHLSRRHLFDQRVESLIELIYRLYPISLSRSDRIEALLGVRSEIVAEDSRELIHKEVVGDTSEVGRQEFTRVGTYHFCFCFVGDLTSGKRQDIVCTLNSLHRSALNILARLDSLNDRSIGRRSTYSEFIHLIHERSFVVAHRRLGERLLSIDS